MTTFNENQIVTARVTRQGMTAGQQYKVAAVLENSTVFGNFVSYKLAPVSIKGQKFWVINLHLLAK